MAMEVEAVTTERDLVATSAASAAANPGGDLSKKSQREGCYLLGNPTFVDLGNGRFRCAETGQEMPALEKESYAKCRACRLALIDSAVAKKTPPLSMFHQHPLSKSKLVCELTGDAINKSEEHIWKHITGRKFQNKLEQKEAEKLAPTESVDRDAKKSKKKSKAIISTANKDLEKTDVDIVSQIREPVENSSDSEEPDFWIPPIGSRWDFDDGKDRWESCTEDDIGSDGLNETNDKNSAELSKQTKRMSIAVGPSSFASRKKKMKKTSPSLPNGSQD